MKPANIGHATSVQLDVSGDCRTFTLYASGCGCEFFLFACVFFCCWKNQIKSLDVILTD